MTTFEVTGELPDLNTYINAERTNRYMAAKIKKEATDLVAWSVMRLPEITKPSNYHFHWIVSSKRKDPDNVAFAAKFIFDGLVVAGKLKNDNMAWVKGIYHTYSVGKPKVIISFDNE